MSVGLLGSLLRLPGRRKRTSQFARPATPCRRPFLESLETRTLPSILIATPRLPDIAELAVSGLADNAGLRNDLRDPQGEGPPAQVAGQGDGPSNDKGITQVGVGVDTLLDVQLDPLDVQLAPLDVRLILDGNGPDDHKQGQDNNDNGQDCGQPEVPGDSQGDNEARQSDCSNNGPLDGPDSGTNAPADGHGGLQEGQNDRTTNSPPGGQGDNQRAQRDTGQGGRANNGPADTSGGRKADARADSTNNGSGIGTGDGTNAPANGQPSASVSKGEERGSVSAPDEKEHGPEGILIRGKKLTKLFSSGSQGPEQNDRNQAAVQSQQQNEPTDDAGRQVEKRVPTPLSSQAPVWEPGERWAIAEAPSTPVGEVPNDFPADTVRDNDHANVSPLSHGLLTDSLSLDFSSLRAEVQSFLNQLDNLGGHPTERQISMILSSGAVVVAAAMACEVARRQARRPASGSMFALACADASSGIGLPNFGEFSASS